MNMCRPIDAQIAPVFSLSRQEMPDITNVTKATFNWPCANAKTAEVTIIARTKLVVWTNFPNKTLEKLVPPAVASLVLKIL